MRLGVRAAQYLDARRLAIRRLQLECRFNVGRLLPQSRQFFRAELPIFVGVEGAKYLGAEAGFLQGQLAIAVAVVPAD